jgi:ferredoxin
MTRSGNALIDFFKTALAGTGMVALGVFHPRADDPLPANARAAVLVGNAGPAMWEAFAAGRPDGQEGQEGPEPLDAWTRRKLEKAAAALEARAFFPFGGPPHLPFQAWGLRTGGAFQSPIGLLIHPRYGLWFAYRGVFAGEWDIAGVETDTASPCRACAGKACLETCPVGALAPSAYDVAACISRLDTPGGADCRDLGCRARRACPVGKDWLYAPAQAAFHMAAFTGKCRPR